MLDHLSETIALDSLLNEHDLEALLFAEKLQLQMLAPPTEIAGYHFDYLYQPKRFVSGDYLDFWAVDGGVLFYLADVSGHGVCSGMVSQWLSGFRARFNDPLTLINAINEGLIGLHISQHITLFTGLIQYTTPDTPVLTYCNAGHFPPAFVFHDNNSLSALLESEQLPLGIMLDADYQLEQIALQPTDRLVICSDGALENYQGDGVVQLALLTEALRTVFVPTEFVIQHPIKDDISMLWITPLK